MELISSSVSQVHILALIFPESLLSKLILAIFSHRNTYSSYSRDGNTIYGKPLPISSNVN